MICDQEPEKLIFFSDHHTLTCARCTGIYVGSFTAGIIMIFFSLNKKLNIKYLLISAGLLLTDVLLYSIGFYSYSKIFAFLTGLFFGSVVFNYFYYALSELNLLIKNRKEN